jgi:ribonuclease HI
VNTILTFLNSKPEYKHYFICLAGDFNFAVDTLVDVTTSSTTTDQYYKQTKSFSAAWDKLLVSYNLVEIHQPAHTYKSTAVGRNTARYDRVYFSLCESDYLLYSTNAKLASNAPGCPYGANTPDTPYVSDHHPVIATLSKKAEKKPSNRHLTDWVIDSHAFHCQFTKLWEKEDTSKRIDYLIKRFDQVVHSAHTTVLRQHNCAPKTRAHKLQVAIKLYKALHRASPSHREIAELRGQNIDLHDMVIPSGDLTFDTTRLRAYLENGYKEVGIPDSNPITEECDVGQKKKNKVSGGKPRNCSLAGVVLPSTKRRLLSLSPVGGEGESTTEPDKMLALLKDFWAPRWTREECREAEDDRKRATKTLFSTYKKRIRSNEMRKAVLEDVEAAIKSMGNSSAGLNGLPFSIYKKLIHIAAPLLLRVIRELEKSKGKVTVDFTNGRVCFFPKSDSDAVDKHRPIIVSNSDYRIIAKVMVQLATPATLSFLDPAQRGFLKGMSIDDNILHFNEEFYRHLSRKQQYYLILYDVAKAFDSVIHDFLHDLLKHLEFPKWFRNVVKSFFRGIKVKANISGVSLWFYISRGIKQGCPLSPLLFVIVMDVLLSSLTQVDKRGFADDTATGIQAGYLEEGLHHTTSRFRLFGRASGCNLNSDKSGSIISTLVPNALETTIAAKYGFKFTDNGVYLGILYGRNVWPHTVYEAACAKATKRIASYGCARASLSKQKRLYVINVYITPIFSFLMRFFMPPAEVLNAWRHMVCTFVGAGTGTRTSLQVLMNTREWGGFRQPIMGLEIKSLATLASLNIHGTCRIVMQRAGKMITMVMAEHRIAAATMLGNYGMQEAPAIDDTDHWHSKGTYTGGGGSIKDITARALNSPFQQNIMRTEVKDRMLKSFLPEVKDLAPYSDVICSRRTAIHRNLEHIYLTQFQLTLGILPCGDFLAHLHSTPQAKAGTKRPRTDPKQKCLFGCRDKESARHYFYKCQVVKDAIAFMIVRSWLPGEAGSLSTYAHAILLVPRLTNLGVNVICVINHGIWKAREYALTMHTTTTNSYNRIISEIRSAFALIPPKIKEIPFLYSPKQGARASTGSPCLAPQCTQKLENFSLLDYDTLTKHQVKARDTLATIPINAVICYTDGSAHFQHGPTGAGAIVIPPNGPPTIGSVAISDGTNNSGELTAVALALDLVEHLDLRNRQVAILSDSKYCIAELTCNRFGTAAKNAALINNIFSRLCKTSNSVKLYKVKGHANIAGNDIADQLADEGATRARLGQGWPITEIGSSNLILQGTSNPPTNFYFDSLDKFPP